MGISSQSGRFPAKRFLAVAALALAGLSSTASAQFITGDIQFTGGATLDTGSLATATAFTQIFGPGGSGTQPLVLGGGTSTGDYAGVPDGTQVAFQTFSFGVSAPQVVPLWSFTVGGTSYAFQTASITVAYQSAYFLDISGTGTATITGFLPTAGNWSITDTGTGGTPVFTFGAATDVGGSPTPEPSTVMLLLVVLPAAYVAFRVRKTAGNSTAK